MYYIDNYPSLVILRGRYNNNLKPRISINRYISQLYFIPQPIDKVI